MKLWGSGVDPGSDLHDLLTASANVMQTVFGNHDHAIAGNGSVHTAGAQIKERIEHSNEFSGVVLLPTCVHICVRGGSVMVRDSTLVWLAGESVRRVA